jgi:hypothetical protein
MYSFFSVPIKSKLAPSFLWSDFRSGKFHFCSLQQPYNDPAYQKLREIQSARFALGADLERLRSQENAHIANRLSELTKFCNSYPDYMYASLSKTELAVYARVLEIFEALKSTHYVFTHGQSSSLFLPVYVLIQETSKLPPHRAWLKFETSLRHSLQIERRKHSVEHYKSRITLGNSDRKHVISLLAADVHLASFSMCESALSIFLSHSWGQGDVEKRDALVHLIAQNYISSLSLQKKFIREFSLFDDECKSGSGVLSAICIPKESFRKCGYLSTSMGIPFRPTTDVNALLEEWQNNPFSYQKAPQVRLLTHKLPAHNVKIFSFPTIEDANYFRLQAAVRETIHKFNKDSR